MSNGQFENVAFADAQRLVESLGFELNHVRGSHHFYIHADVRIVLNLQPRRGEAKSYQLRELLRDIQRYDLRLEDRS
jgi:predicted RNA binding protein YcfA (HicA-like mRNA interferase family)